MSAQRSGVDAGEEPQPAGTGEANRPHPFTPQAITRSADHRYTYEGVTYPGVTSILKVLDKSDALMSWAARQTAQAAVTMAKERALDLLLDAVGDEGAIKALTSRSSWQRDEAAQLGTEVHRLADAYLNGGDMAAHLPGKSASIVGRVTAYADWWKASGWTLRLSEAMVVRPVNDDTPEKGPVGGWGGTFDLLAKDRDGKTVLADIKTGKGVYREAVLQLAAYGMASKVQYSDGKVYTMPVPDRYVVLHVTLDGVREVELSIGTAERMAFLACLDLWHWVESMKGKRL